MRRLIVFYCFWSGLSFQMHSFAKGFSSQACSTTLNDSSSTTTVRNVPNTQVPSAAPLNSKKQWATKKVGVGAKKTATDTANDLVAFLDQRVSDTLGLSDTFDLSEVDSQAMDEVEKKGVKHVRADRAVLNVDSSSELEEKP